MPIDETRERWRWVPDRGAPAGPGDELLRLACLRYTADDGPARWARARELAAALAGLARASVHVAAAVGDVDAVREALAGDPAAADRPGGPHGWPPLLYVTYSRVGGGDPVGVVDALLAAGADPNAGFLWDGHLPPFTALTGVFGGGEGGVANQPPHPQWRPLAQALLAAGADPDDEQTLYNRHFEPDDAHLELLFAAGLGRGGGVWARRLAPLKPTPIAAALEDQLLFAALRGLTDRVVLLLGRGVAPDGRGTRHPVTHGRTAVQLAIDVGAEAVAAVLLAAGAAPPALDPVEALLAAAMRGDRAAVEAAPRPLAAEAVARDPARLAVAAGRGAHEAVRLLVALGFDPSHRARTTPLHEAAWRGDRETSALLLSLGADPTVRDAEHAATPAQWARHAGHGDLADWLATHEP